LAIPAVGNEVLVTDGGASRGERRTVTRLVALTLAYAVPAIGLWASATLCHGLARASLLALAFLLAFCTVCMIASSIFVVWMDRAIGRSRG
jgi:hypothetical protein